MIALTQTLATNPTLLIAACAVLGLLIGSFLNVVILRLPAMMEQRWQRDARETLALSAAQTAPHGTGAAPEHPEEARQSLWSPPSCCPNCGHRIRPWHNIPVLSWLLLRGRCADCKTPISGQYPLVELLGGIVAAVCAWRFGWSPQLAGALVFSWALLTLGMIDLRTLLLPDSITLPLLWLGLLLSLGQIYVGPQAAIAGAAAGYLVLWVIYHGFRLATGKEGMGHGDFKLLAALGAWLGYAALPMVILLSSLMGLVFGVSLLLLHRHQRAAPLSFGPYLAGAGWLAMVFGTPLVHAASHLAGAA